MLVSLPPPLLFHRTSVFGQKNKFSDVYCFALIHLVYNVTLQGVDNLHGKMYNIVRAHTHTHMASSPLVWNCNLSTSHLGRANSRASAPFTASPLTASGRLLKGGSGWSVRGRRREGLNTDACRDRERSPGETEQRRAEESV